MLHSLSSNNFIKEETLGALPPFPELWQDIMAFQIVNTKVKKKMWAIMETVSLPNPSESVNIPRSNAATQKNRDSKGDDDLMVFPVSM